MPGDRWQLEKHSARLQVDRLAAKVDLEHPRHGLIDVCACSAEWSGARLLGITAGWFRTGEGIPPTERVARGCDLIATYDESPGRATRMDAMWRVRCPTPAERFVAGVELVVSVRTQQRECRPGWVAQSRFPACEARRLVDVRSAAYERLLPPGSLQPQQGPGCVLFRPPNAAFSYAEMVHAADFRRDELNHLDDALSLEHDLFPDFLEKGVILRARVRGCFLPRQHDTRLAADCYRSFLAADPPLAAGS
jgi:hypothetical protein